MDLQFVLVCHSSKWIIPKWDSSFPHISPSAISLVLYLASVVQVIFQSPRLDTLQVSLMKVRCAWQHINVQLFNRHLETKAQVE